MKKFYFPFLSLLIVAHSVTMAQSLSTNGYAHTPQGELHILLLFAGDESKETLVIPEWEYGTVPVWAYDFFETDAENIGNNDNLSKYYYELSKFSPDPFSFPAGFAHQYNLNCATLREIPFPSRVNRAHRILITII